LRRPVRGVLLVVVVLVGAAACAGQSDEVEAAVEVFGPWQGADAAHFRDVLDGFEAETGIPARYVGTTSFASQLRERSLEASLPDVAVVPQPGLVAELVDRGQAVPLAPSATDLVAQNFRPDIAALGQLGGSQYGVPIRLAVKSLVWYPPAALDGPVPHTLDELVDATASTRAEGTAPWCYTIEALGSTGYLASDWIEDVLLRLYPPAVYDAALRLELPLDGPEMRAALEWYSRELLGPGRVEGGRERILTTPVERAMDPMLADPPECLFHRQANSFRTNLPSSTTIGRDADVNVFVLPDESGGEPPILLAGDMAVAFDDRPEVNALMRYLARPESMGPWIAAGGYLAPYRDVDPSDYPDRFDASVARRLGEADVVRFDLSDSWPPGFGSGIVWDVLTRFTAGAISLDDALAELEAGRQEALVETAARS
jgi:alpha-glucoside transport system substrate-binding protein